jgi:2'-5' RNA ligase
MGIPPDFHRHEAKELGGDWIWDEFHRDETPFHPHTPLVRVCESPPASSQPFPPKTGTSENEQARNHRCLMTAQSVERAYSYDWKFNVNRRAWVMDWRHSRQGRGQ